MQHTPKMLIIDLGLGLNIFVANKSWPKKGKTTKGWKTLLGCFKRL
jgi:hypothetical protein